MKYFVTGASGFVGQKLIHNLLQNGHEICALIHNKELKIQENSSVEMVWGDLDQPSTYSDHLKDCDVVIHCSWDSRKAGKSREENADINVSQTIQLIEVATKSNVKRFVGLSTLEVYGYESFSNSDFEEGNELAEPSLLSDFAYAKMQMEKAMDSCFEQDEIAMTIVRVGQIYSDLKPPINLPAFGHYSFFAGFGNNHLPFVHIDAVADLLLRILEKTDAVEFEIVNAAPAHRDTARAVLRRWKKQNGSSGRVIYLPIPCYKALGLCIKAVVKVLRPGYSSDSITRKVGTLSRNVGYSTRLAYEKYGWIGY